MENNFNINLELLRKKEEEAIFYFDVPGASRLYKQIEHFILEENIRESNQEIYKELQSIIIRLKILSFSTLSDEEATDILKNHYLESFAVDSPMDMKTRIEGKLFMIPYLVRDALRENLRQALLQNKQSLGSLTLGQWIETFDKNFAPENRSEKSVFDFMTSNRFVQALPSTERNQLKEFLHTYDACFIDTLPLPEPLLDAALKAPAFEKLFTSEKGQTNIQRSNLSSEYSPREESVSLLTAKLTLEYAMKKYPDLGEQLITSNRIRLKNFSEAVRPSIKNWLSDYTFTMGFDPHDSATRGTYLFRNANAATLSPADKNRLSHILKAFDTNEPVEINLTLKQVLFPQPEMMRQPLARAERLAKTPLPETALERSWNHPASKTFSPASTFSQAPRAATSRPVAQNYSPQRAPIKSSPAPVVSPQPRFSGNFTMSPKDSPATKTSPERPSFQAPTARIEPPLRRDFLPPAKTSAPVELPLKSRMEFTSPQKLPFENQSPAPSSFTNTAPRPSFISNSASQPKEIVNPTPQPIKITPSHFERNYRSKNIVDLKE